MATEVILPKIDMDMATGRISRWFFREGDSVAKGDVLFEIETDKAAMEVDSPAGGILRNVTGAEGVDIAVGAAVAWIYAEGEAVSGPAAGGPVITVRATPLARRLAREKDLDLAAIKGSGPQGRIVRADVEKMMATATEGVRPATEGADTVLRHYAEGSYVLQPHSSMRRTIARRLVEAKSTTPHFYLSVDCRLDALLALRARLNAADPLSGGVPAYKLSVNDMVIKAYALALAATPDANVSWTEDGLARHRLVDVGVAVSVPGGLVTPIIRDAGTKSMSAISGEIKELAARARAGKLAPEEYRGGTGAVSNLGMYGVKEFAAIINPPHATILAVGAGQRRPVVAENDELVAATVMTVTLATDHRAVDGVLGAELIGRLRSLIENPIVMLA